MTSNNGSADLDQRLRDVDALLTRMERHIRIAHYTSVALICAIVALLIWTLTHR